MLLRIHHITDQAYHGAGILLDNIRIAAIDFTDDAEAASDYWTVAGFVRSTNIVPQQWSVQAVLFDADDEGSLVTPLSLDTTDTGGHRYLAGLDRRDRAPHPGDRSDDLDTRAAGSGDHRGQLHAQ